ncbi:MAG: hypothetical protein HY784_15290 [Chloroflexi bacterium]|nr:hypothetical protein [Chloroflexota bacterium]
MRAHAAQTQTRLIIGGLALLFVVGGGLIWLIYGPGVAVLGLTCMAVGLLPAALIWGALALLERISRDRDEER